MTVPRYQGQMTQTG